MVENENKYTSLLKIIKTKNMSIKKVTTEMINSRLYGAENTIKDLIDMVLQKLGGMEK
jgi:hypothetical protein